MIRIIVAFDEELGIAKDGAIPWDLPGDRRSFKKHTLQYGGIVVMGRRTFETLPGPLAGRTNVVVTTSQQVITSVRVINNFDDYLQQYRKGPDIWIIGGELIYAQSLGAASEIYATRILSKFDCDTYFPAFMDNFILQEQSDPQEERGLSYRYEHYKRAGM